MNEWFPVRKPVKLDVKAYDEVEIVSEPAGDLRHMWSAVFERSDKPTVQEVAGGGWMYKILRFSVYIQNPPVDMYLSVHTHHALSAVRRGYLYPTDYPPRFEEMMFSGAYKATLSNYYYQVAVATLPGDRVFITLESKEPFRGALRTLSYL
jgi:hypothetical protein